MHTLPSSQRQLPRAVVIGFYYPICCQYHLRHKVGGLPPPPTHPPATHWYAVVIGLYTILYVVYVTSTTKWGVVTCQGTLLRAHDWNQRRYSNAPNATS